MSPSINFETGQALRATLLHPSSRTFAAHFGLYIHFLVSVAPAKESYNTFPSSVSFFRVQPNVVLLHVWSSTTVPPFEIPNCLFRVSIVVFPHLPSPFLPFVFSGFLDRRGGQHDRQQSASGGHTSFIFSQRSILSSAFRRSTRRSHFLGSDVVARKRDQSISFDFFYRFCSFCCSVRHGPRIAGLTVALDTLYPCTR